jgi:O-antigen/teichoic acid export membrane protein
MSNNTSNSKRIVKNTVILYARMIVIMLITLFSSRIILHALGTEDYGLYNVVGGVVMMLGFLKSSLTSSTQRFLSYEMGRQDSDENRLQHVFSLCLTTHILIAIVIIVLAETIGLWFLNTHIQIPDDRITAANWVFHYSVISLALSMITVPYHACVISHEKMSFFALVSIIDAILKLVFAYAIMVSPTDRLSFYAFLMMFTNVVNIYLYWLYSTKHFSESKYVWFWDTKTFKKIFSFSGWTILGQLAVVGSAQGKSVLVNIFHSVTANAAMGIAQQVNSALASLTSNFQTAFQPQLTKSYSAKEYEQLNNLIFVTSKISFFLLFIVSFPIMLNIDWVLNIWLVEVPQYSGIFCNLYIVASILNALATPLWISVYATGKIKHYQLAVTVAYFAELFVVYLFFKAGYPPTTAFVIKAVLNAVMVFIRLYFANHNLESFSISCYAKRVMAPVSFSTIMTLIVAFFLMRLADELLMRLFLTLIVTLISILLAYMVGLNENEKQIVQSYVLRFKKRIRILKN